MYLVEGCTGKTTCGNGVGGFSQYDLANNGVMATFSFQLSVKDILQSFKIIKSGNRDVRRKSSTGSGTSAGSRRRGCGATIAWTDMCPVVMPSEVVTAISTINTEDVPVLPTAANTVREPVNISLTGAIFHSFLQTQLNSCKIFTGVTGTG